MKYLYRIYQLFVAIPILIVWTIFIALLVIIGCALGNGNFWGYYPGKWWSWVNIRLFLLPVTVEGRSHLEKGKSYVFVSNHQGAFDIFLIYGFLGRHFKWMMKHQIQKIPFVGRACKASNQIMVDKRGPKKIKATYDKAREVLTGGVSLVVFPEGARTFTGHMASFKRGAFMLADDLQLPVVPITINGFILGNFYCSFTFSLNVIFSKRNFTFRYISPRAFTSMISSASNTICSRKSAIPF